MINPNGDDFVEDNPLAASMQSSGEKGMGETGPGLRRATRQISAAAGETWQQTKQSANAARQRTEIFMRDNPIPTIAGALALGLALGWALRNATSREEKEIEIESPLGRLSFLSLPFLWPVFKSIKEKFEDSSEAVKDSVGRLKKIDIDRYAKPVRKRWKALTR
jgi:ElaB/YqjD/DUF883 family membrane-anchored ribosome-binding protein